MMAHIGQRIQMYRKRLKIGQDVVAAACGITRQAVSRWERGLQEPDEAKLPVIAATLGVDVCDLTGVLVYPSETGSVGLPAEWAEYGKYMPAQYVTLLTLAKIDDEWKTFAFDNLDTGEPFDPGVLLVEKSLFSKKPYAVKIDSPSQISAIPLRSMALVDFGADVSTGGIALIAIDSYPQFARVYPSEAVTVIENDSGRLRFSHDDPNFEIIGPVVELRITAQYI